MVRVVKQLANPNGKFYLSKLHLLTEIHASKMSYCSILAPEYSDYHTIVQSVDEITPELIETTRLKLASPRGNGGKNHVDPSTIDLQSIVVRVMTWEHIPPLAEGVSRGKARGDGRDMAPVNFPPFKHYILTANGPKEVARSHWVGGFANGYFSADHGKLTNRLAKMYLLFVTKYASRGNWRGYTFREDMESAGLMQLVQSGLKFDESKSDNPFAYITQIVKNVFTRQLNLEKTQRGIRDDILEMSNARPSLTRQISEL